MKEFQLIIILTIAVTIVCAVVFFTGRAFSWAFTSAPVVALHDVNATGDWIKCFHMPNAAVVMVKKDFAFKGQAPYSVSMTTRIGGVEFRQSTTAKNESAQNEIFNKIGYNEAVGFYNEWANKSRKSKI